ncbi:hypothetical protein CN692_24670 [Bacillus sp. AFS002410]|uniref:DUF421 domain-containing protein n=1 Tax=Bacillus sp. AFS002410 TaxID=2033481 RepID=UPI000BF21FA5|nr:DUF421 domain-containing protein [Bacillus sp. AFS002410]PEJ47747.1 hypothetical protein CN692_24670 [Bacillus sp. AFS002410]
MSLNEVLFRVICSFFVLFILTRLMGKKEISQLDVFTFITAITIGNIAASLTTSKTLDIEDGITGLVGWAVLTIIMGYISLKSKSARRLILGEPIILIRQGKIMENALKKAKLDTEQFQGMLRSENIYSFKDVEYAIFEIDGSLSVMKTKDVKTKKNKAWKKTLVFPTSTAVITDGEVNEDALSDLNLDKKWLNAQLERAGIHSISDVFLVEVQTDGSLYIDYREDQLNEVEK